MFFRLFYSLFLLISAFWITGVHSVGHRTDLESVWSTFHWCCSWLEMNLISIVMYTINAFLKRHIIKEHFNQSNKRCVWVVSRVCPSPSAGLGKVTQSWCGWKGQRSAAKWEPSWASWLLGCGAFYQAIHSTFSLSWIVKLVLTCFGFILGRLWVTSCRAGWRRPGRC